MHFKIKKKKKKESDRLKKNVIYNCLRPSLVSVVFYYFFSIYGSLKHADLYSDCFDFFSQMKVSCIMLISSGTVIDLKLGEFVSLGSF